MSKTIGDSTRVSTLRSRSDAEGEVARAHLPTIEAPSEADSAPKKATGFARLTPEQRKQLARRGGHAAHASGNANRFTSESASRAGKIAHERGTAHSWNSETAREAGRKGGSAQRSSKHDADS